MIKTLATGASLLVNLMLTAAVIGTLVPGTHRVLAPASFGLVEIAPRVWTDAPARRSQLLGLVGQARQTVSDFFGSPPNPTLVLCSTRACARDFGIGGNGLSIADVVVMVSPGGLTLGTLTHEMTHSRLHRAMGLRNLIRQPFPTWFDEGLATHVADHPRWSGSISASDRQRVRKVQRFWDWDDAYDDLGVGRAYRTAAAEVEAIETAVGRAGLLQLIARAESGENFDDVLKALLGS